MKIRGWRGTYETLTKLTTGGMGVIWLGRGIDGAYRGREVVIKAPRLDRADIRQMCIDKLKVEIDILKMLNHPYIVKYYDDCQVSNIPILVMEYIKDSMTLRDYVYRHGPLDERTALEIMRKLLEAIVFLHNRNIVWRDLSANNVLVYRKDPKRIKLIDFGAAKYFYDGLKVITGQTRVWTPHYSHPEQRDRGLVAPQCDIYSAGCIAYFMLTGREPPMMGALDPSADPRKFNPHISDHVAEAIIKAMNPDLRRTFQTALDFLNALLGKGHFPMGIPHLIHGSSISPIHGDWVIVGRSAWDVFLFHEDGYMDKVVRDKGPYISRYDPSQGLPGHIKIERRRGRWFLKRLGENVPAVYRSGRWIPLKYKGAEIELHDGDLIALAYNPVKGTYIQLTFRLS